MDNHERHTAQSPGPAPPRDAKARAKADRLAREAAALRSNLRKRKDQERQRNEQTEPLKPDSQGVDGRA